MQGTSCAAPWEDAGVNAMNEEVAASTLIDDWIATVRSRPNAMCGIFLDDSDGQPGGSRARPWDEPDLLVSAVRADHTLSLRFDRYGAVIDIEITDITAVEANKHPWGEGVRVTGTISGAATQIWLV